MRWDDGNAEGRIRFSASAHAVEGYGGRGVDGMAFAPRAGYLFRDHADNTWWIVFQPYSDPGFHGDQVFGDILACSAAYDEVVHVSVLASGVRRADAEAAFRQGSPITYEEAVEVTRQVRHGVR
jgi:hypothetical protein